MIYKKRKNLFLILILSSLFLKLFYAADENKYKDLIKSSLQTEFSDFCCSLIALKKEIINLKENEDDYFFRNQYGKYKEEYKKSSYKCISKIYNKKIHANESVEHEEKEQSQSFISLHQKKSNDEDRDDKINKINDDIISLENEKVKKIYFTILPFFHNIFFENTYNKFFKEEPKKSIEYLNRIYDFLEYYFEDHQEFFNKIGYLDGEIYSALKSALSLFYVAKRKLNKEKIDFLFESIEGIEYCFKSIFMKYIALRQVLEENGVPLDRLKNEYGFKQMNDMNQSYTQELTYTTDILLSFKAKEMRRYIGFGSLGLSVGFGIYDFVDMFFFRNGNFFSLDGFCEIKRLTINDVKNGIVDIYKEPRQNKAKMAMFLSAGIGVWFGTRNFILERKKEKLKHITENLNFKKFFEENKISEKMKKNKEAFLQKKNLNEIKG